jgi:uncharacterized damage-inducible protein DinB
MSIIQMLVKEMEQEAQTTRKMLSRIPNDQYQWRPHHKSMTIQQLSTHIAELLTWVPLVLDTTELDFATAPYEPSGIDNTANLLAMFGQFLESARLRLLAATDADLEPNWTLRNGEQILSSSSKGEMIRVAFSQTVHHRAQLGVYLRLLDIPIPGSYGPSADDPNF